MNHTSSNYDFRLAGVLGIAFLVAAAACAAFNPALLKPHPQKAFLNGGWAASYSKEFDNGVPIRQGAISGLSALNYFAFGEGRDGVLVGDDGWLFSSEEMTQSADPKNEIASKHRYVNSAVKTLEARGIRVIVAVIPAKLRVYPEHGGGYSMLPQLRAVYADQIRQLRAEGIEAPDLLAPLQQQKDNGQVFLRTDTHWTPFGAQIVANTLGSAIGPDRPWTETSFRYVPGKVVSHDGDLKNYLPLGPWKAMGPAPDTLQTGAVISDGASAGGGLLGPSYVPVALVGTSYSFNPKWQFENALKVALGTDIMNVSREGRGPFRPMQEFLESKETVGNPPKILLWEIPERYFWSTDKQVGLPK